MALPIPTLSELYNEIIADLESKLQINIPLVGKFFLRALAAVQAAKLKLYYLSVARVQKNIGPDTADPQELGGTLDRWGSIKGLNRFPATQGRYEVDVTGQVAGVIPAGTIFKSNDDSQSPGQFFQNDVELTLVATTGTLEIRALVGGSVSELAIGDKLTSTVPLLNVDDLVTVAVEVEQPLDQETVEDYRTRVLDSFQLEAQGGAATDYRLWSADAQGVRFVYPYAKDEVCSELNLYIEANQSDSIDGKGTPTAEIVLEVETVVNFDPDVSQPLNERGRRPVQAIVNYLPVAPKDVVITINSPVNIDASTQTLIETALVNLTNDIRPFVAAADIIENKNDVLSINVITAEIQSVLEPGQSFSNLTLVVDGETITISKTFTDGDIPFLITPITYNPPI